MKTIEQLEYETRDEISEYCSKLYNRKIVLMLHEVKNIHHEAFQRIMQVKINKNK